MKLVSSVKLLSLVDQVCSESVEVVDLLSTVTTMSQLQYEAMRAQGFYTVQHKTMRTSEMSMIQCEAMRVGNYDFGECCHL